jgi:hypothetical protein
LGGSNYDQAYSINKTTDSGYIVAGWSASNDGDVSGSYGGRDYWVVKLKYDLPTSLTGFPLLRASIYPNPARDYCLISWSLNNIATQVFIYDLAGRKINAPVTKVETGKGIKIETASLEEGFYFVILLNATSGEKEVAMFLKME